MSRRTLVWKDLASQIFYLCNSISNNQVAIKTYQMRFLFHFRTNNMIKTLPLLQGHIGQASPGRYLHYNKDTYFAWLIYKGSQRKSRLSSKTHTSVVYGLGRPGAMQTYFLSFILHPHDFRLYIFTWKGV